MMSSPASNRADPVAERHPQRGELRVAAAERALEDEAAVGERRQRPELLGGQHRMPEREQHQDARRPVAPLGEEPAHHRGVLVVRERPGGVMVADEQRIETGVARGHRPLDHHAGARPGVVDGPRTA